MTNFKLSTFDIPMLNRHAIGFDRMFEDLTRFASRGADQSYPPYNIVKVNESEFAVEVAVAGFKEDEITVETIDGSLTVTGNQNHVGWAETAEYLHKGISNRNFSRTFQLAENVKVNYATVVDGILTVTLQQIFPEEKKAKRIKVSHVK